MHFASNAQPRSSASTTDAPSAIDSAGRRSCAATSAPSSANAAYTSVRFVYCHEASGDSDQMVVSPTHTASEKSAARKAAPAPSSIGAGSAPARSRCGGERREQERDASEPDERGERRPSREEERCKCQRARGHGEDGSRSRAHRAGR